MNSAPRDAPASPSETRNERRPSQPSLLDRVRSLFGLGAASIRDDIEDALEETDTSGVFTAQERALLKNVLALHEIRVEDVMVPRADVMAISSQARLGEVLAVFREVGHSRLPVHGENLDDPKGMVHIRDFVEFITAPVSDEAGGEQRAVPVDLGQSLDSSGIMRSVLFVPPSMLALDLLVRMQATRTHMALVIDEFGGTDGLVTIEDLVEAIVGDIEDEHDEDERPKIEAGADATFVADARADLEDVSQIIGIDVAAGLEAEDVDTLGGLVTSLAGRVPAKGDVIDGTDRVTFEVLDADPRRVKRVLIRLASPPEVTGAEPRPSSGETPAA